MKRNPLVPFFIALIVAAMLFAAIRFAHKHRANGPANGQLIGNLAPDFELPTLDGKTMKLSDFRGKAVLLNFWATWCEPLQSRNTVVCRIAKTIRPARIPNCWRGHG